MILAQTTGWIVSGGVGLAIIGVYVWVSSHIANRKRHPDAANVVYTDTCEATQKRYDEHNKASEKRADERHEDLKDDIKELKGLVIANGKPK